MINQEWSTTNDQPYITRSFGPRFVANDLSDLKNQLVQPFNPLAPNQTPVAQASCPRIGCWERLKLQGISKINRHKVDEFLGFELNIDLKARVFPFCVVWQTSSCSTSQYLCPGVSPLFLASTLRFLCIEAIEPDHFHRTPYLHKTSYF